MIWRQALSETLVQDRNQCVQAILELFGTKTSITDEISSSSLNEQKALLDVLQSVSDLLSLSTRYLTLF